MKSGIGGIDCLNSWYRPLEHMPWTDNQHWYNIFRL